MTLQQQEEEACGRWATDLVHLLSHARSNADQVVVSQTLEQGQPPHKLEGTRTWCMPHHKLHTDADTGMSGITGVAPRGVAGGAAA